MNLRIRKSLGQMIKRIIYTKETMELLRREAEKDERRLAWDRGAIREMWDEAKWGDFKKG